MAEAAKREPMVSMRLDMSPSSNAMLEELADEKYTTKADILRRALALYKVATDAARDNKGVGIFNEKREVVSDFINL